MFKLASGNPVLFNQVICSSHLFKSFVRLLSLMKAKPLHDIADMPSNEQSAAKGGERPNDQYGHHHRRCEFQAKASYPQQVKSHARHTSQIIIRIRIGTLSLTIYKDYKLDRSAMVMNLLYRPYRKTKVTVLMEIDGFCKKSRFPISGTAGKTTSLPICEGKCRVGVEGQIVRKSSL